MGPNKYVPFFWYRCSNGFCTLGESMVVPYCSTTKLLEMGVALIYGDQPHDEF